jgi:hypothetical protein
MATRGVGPSFRTVTEFVFGHFPNALAVQLYRMPPNAVVPQGTSNLSSLKEWQTWLTRTV